MNFFQDFDWSAKSIAKVIGAVLLGFVGLAVVAMLVSFSIRTIVEPFNSPRYGGGFAESSVQFDKGIGIPPPFPDGAVDQDAEQYEVQDYSVSYSPNDKTEICTTVAALKSREDVIFENASESDRNCNYTFKVLKEKAAEILALLEEFDPENVNSNVYTIQRTIEGLTDELDILNKKLVGIEGTLTEAQTSYDELTKLATRKQDVESLTRLIELKLNTIERLANERRDIAAQIESYERSKAEQLERIKYTNFSVSVYEDRLIDWKQIGDSWRYEIQYFFTSINEVVQGVTVQLATFVLRAVQAIVYIILAVVLLKLVWLMARKVWRYRRD